MTNKDTVEENSNKSSKHFDKNNGAYTSVLQSESSSASPSHRIAALLQNRQPPIPEQAFQPKSPVNQGNFAETCSGIIASIATAIAINWFSGPYIAVAAREIYEWLCNHLFGNYQWYDPRFYTVHVPAREHVSHFGYVYGPYIVGTLMLPLVYKGFGKCWRWMQSCWETYRDTSEETTQIAQAISDEALLQAVDEVRIKLEKLSLEGNPAFIPTPLQSSPTLLSSEHKTASGGRGKNLTKSISSPSLLHAEMESDNVYPRPK